MIKVLIFGKYGQLGRSLALRSKSLAGLSLQFLDRRACDVSKSSDVVNAINFYRPDIIINATAYTAVDLAESEVEIAQLINCDAVRIMAASAARQSLPFIHISTDYVFDGGGSRPYRETDPAGPLGVYGQTKLAGEEAVRSATEKHLIFRTSWSYSPYGNNFVKTMLRLLSIKNEIAVVNDQYGCPTSSLDLAAAILRILPDVTQSNGFDKFGIYHLSSDTPMTWYQFSRAIQAEARKQFGENWPGLNCEIKDVTGAEYPTIAKRPTYSVMSMEKFKANFGFGLPDFGSSLLEVLQRVAQTETL